MRSGWFWAERLQGSEEKVLSRTSGRFWADHLCRCNICICSAVLSHNCWVAPVVVLCKKKFNGIKISGTMSQQAVNSVLLFLKSRETQSGYSSKCIGSLALVSTLYKPLYSTPAMSKVLNQTFRQTPRTDLFHRPGFNTSCTHSERNSIRLDSLF